MDEFGTLVKGRVSDLVFKHDASRIVQSALKYGDKGTRANIAAELKGTYVALAQSKFPPPLALLGSLFNEGRTII